MSTLTAATMLLLGSLLGAVICSFSDENYGDCLLDVIGGDLPCDMVSDHSCSEW